MKKATCLGLFLTLLFPLISLAQNVGIGTTTPQFKLDVNGRMRIKTGTLNDVNTSSGLWLEDFRNGTNRMFIGMQDSIRAGFYGNGGADWGFNFNALTGNVGIGRIASSSRLELADVNGGDLALYKGTTFGGRIIATDTSLQIYARRTGLCIIGQPCPPPGDLILQPPSDDIFSTTGRVGIGTNAPAAKLHVTSSVMIGSGTPAAGYMLSVNGKVVSEELKIQLDTNWPDYVFDRSYQLPSIDDMKKYIAENKHLRNIPSAEEVKNEGILVGDMQKKMMEKIEELSLYIIQLHERIKQLEAAKK